MVMRHMFILITSYTENYYAIVMTYSCSVGMSKECGKGLTVVTEMYIAIRI